MRSTSSLIFGGGSALVLAIVLSGCGKVKQNDPHEADATRAEAKRQKAACGSSVGYDRLKALVFDQAVERRSGDHANLDTLADYSTVRMEDPVVQGWDPALDITRCKGHFILDIPPGAERGLGGERRLQADIGYTAQAAADGNGLVYRMSGAEPIIARLTAFNLASGGFRPPPAIDEQRTPLDGSKPVVVAAAVPVAVPSAAPGQAPPSVRNGSRSDPGEPMPNVVRGSEVAVREPSEPMAVSAPDGDGEATVRAFYGALGAGNGGAASARMIPEKRSRGAFSPDAMSRFYGKLPEPIRLTQVVPLGGAAYRVSYRYSAGRSRCAGSAVVRLTTRDGRALIRSISALNGC